MSVNVRRSQRIDEPLAVILARRPRVLDDGQGLWAVLGQYALHRLADFLKCGIPAYGLEAAVCGALHRLRQASVRIGPLGGAVAAAAERAFGVGMTPHALHRFQLSVHRGGH